MAAAPIALHDARQPQATPSRPRRHLHVAPRRRRTWRYVVVMVAMAAGAVFGAVALNALAAEESFAARELQLEVQELRRTADELTVEVTRLESPARLASAAKKHLGMVHADQPAFVMLPGDASGGSRSRSRTMTASVSGG